MISNSTQRCNRKFNKANYCKEHWTKARTVLGRDDLTLIKKFVAFSWTVGMKNRTNLDYEKLVNLTEQPGNLIPLDRGEGVPMFRCDGEDRLWWRRLSQPDHEGLIPASNRKNKQELRIAIWILRI